LPFATPFSKWLMRKYWVRLGKLSLRKIAGSDFRPFYSHTESIA